VRSPVLTDDKGRRYQGRNFFFLNTFINPAFHGQMAALAVFRPAAPAFDLLICKPENARYRFRHFFVELRQIKTALETRQTAGTNESMARTSAC